MQIEFGLVGEAGIGKAIRLGNAADGGYYAMVRGQDLVFVLSREQVEALLMPLSRPAPDAPAITNAPPAAPEAPPAGTRDESTP